MDSLLQITAYSLPMLVAFCAAMVVVVFIGATATSPSVLVYPFLLLLFFISDVSFGRVDAVAPSIFGRGAGYLLFPLFFWLVLLSLTWAKTVSLFQTRSVAPVPPLPINRWFFAWAVLLLLHALAALVLQADLRLALGPMGFSYVVWAWVVFLLVVTTVRSVDAVTALTRFVLVAGVCRAVYGLGRWAAFGGDPTNAYANRLGLNLKLTYFDVYDSVLCMMAVCIAAMWLFCGKRDGAGNPFRTLLLWACMALPTLCIVLSFRRTAAIGLMLGGLFLLWQLPVRARWQLALIAAPGAVAGALYAIWKRLSQTSAAGGLDRFLFDLTPSKIGPESLRLLELKLAWGGFLDSPLFGVGAWGAYGSSDLISWQTDSGGTFLHSGVLHVALKSGIVGLVLLAGLALSFTLFWRRVGRQLSPATAPLAVAGVSAVLFAMPDFLIGTPITRVRAMAMLGFCMALPYVAAIVSGALALQRQDAAVRVRARGSLGGVLQAQK